MIKKYKTVEYALVCDECGEETPSDSDAKNMLKTARDNGWKVYNPLFEQISGICPSCQETQKAGEETKSET